MDLLKQCQQWFEQDEAQKVIDTLEAIPAEERTPELDSELAKAYIAVAHIGEREPFRKRRWNFWLPDEEYFRRRSLLELSNRFGLLLSG